MITLFGTVLAGKKYTDGDPLAILKFFNLMGGGTYFGTWTLVIEFKFYLFFPAAYGYFTDRFVGPVKKYAPYFGLIGLGMLLRMMYYVQTGNSQEISYWTIFGRIDQFMFGVIACLALKDILRGVAPARQKLVGLGSFGLGMLALFLLWSAFNRAGGYYHMPTYPSPSKLWIVLPSIEGALYGTILIGWVLVSGTWRGRI